MHPAESYRDVFAETGVGPARAVLSEARTLARRTVATGKRAIALALLPPTALALGAALLGVPVAAWRLRRAPDPWLGLLEPDATLRAAAAVLAAGFAAAALVFAALLCRIVGRTKRDGRITRAWSVRVETDEVVWSLGVWQTAVALLFLIPAAAIAVAGASLPWWYVAESGAFPAQACIAAAIACALGLTWFLLVFPFQWALPLMAEHDCGWLMAMEASTRLVALAPRWNLAVGGAAALAGATIVGLPAAAAILVCGRDAFGPVVPLLLRERTLKDTRKMLRRQEEAAPVPRGVRRGHGLLEAGRYLDAANSFQMVLFDQIDHPGALRGLCLAYLHLGNLTHAKERLERWQRVEPGDAQAAELLRQLAAGEWSEGGARWKAAKERCTQEIGKGLTNEETLSAKGLDALKGGRMRDEERRRE